MKKQAVLTLLLGIQTIAVLMYTYAAFQNEGTQLFAIFLSNIQSITWNGQFNLDFSSYLLLSGLWIMWRGNFSTSSIAWAAAAAIIGIIIFAPYLLYLLSQADGDLKKVLIGER